MTNLSSSQRFDRRMGEIYKKTVIECTPYNPRYLISDVNKNGGVQTAVKYLSHPLAQEGFHKLCKEYKRPELTIEFQILQPEFIELFESGILDEARIRLKLYGFEVDANGSIKS